MGSGSNEDSVGQNRSAVRRASLSPAAFCPGFRPSRHLLLSVISRRNVAPPLRAAVWARRCPRV